MTNVITSPRKRRTSYDKIRELVQIHPNSAAIKTALRHFGDDALLRELQRRNAMPEQTTLSFFGDAQLVDEYRQRELNLDLARQLRQAIDAKNWEDVEEIYWDMT